MSSSSSNSSSSGGGNTGRRVLIVGGGVAGPCAALFLRRAGYDAVLYELRSDMTSGEEGQFLGIQSNGMRVLQSLGLSEKLHASGSPMTSMTFFNGELREIGNIGYGAISPEGCFVKRSSVHVVLRDEVHRQGIVIHYGRRLVDVELLPNGRVTIRFEDGSSDTGDMLLGCDGLHSRVRRTLFPHSPQPEATGLCGIGGIAQLLPSAHELTQHRRGVLRMVYGYHGFFGYMVDEARRICWWTTFDTWRLKDAPTPQTAQWRRDLCLQVHAEDNPLLCELIRATPDAELGNVTVIHDIQSTPVWFKGPVLLMGDASHATAPHAGQGASMAFEDGYCIAYCLQKHARPHNDSPSAIEAAFQAFQEMRQARVERVIQMARQSGSLKTTSNFVMRFLRDLFLPIMMRFFVTPEKLAWMSNENPILLYPNPALDPPNSDEYHEQK